MSSKGCAKKSVSSPPTTLATCRAWSTPLVRGVGEEGKEGAEDIDDPEKGVEEVEEYKLEDAKE